MSLVIFYEFDLLWVDGPEYTYSDTDFCLFAQNPQQSNIVYILGSENLFNCTITIRWLVSNYFTEKIENLTIKWPEFEHIYSICANSSNKTFSFEPFLNKCNLTRDKSEKAVYAEYYQVRFILEFIQDLVIFVAIPYACALGLLLNVLIIRAVHKNREKELKDDF
jgi:hypothetical protein